MDCHFEDIECGKYQFVFLSVENILVKPFFSLVKKKATPFYQSMRAYIKKITVGKLSSVVV